MPPIEAKIITQIILTIAFLGAGLSSKYYKSVLFIWVVISILIWTHKRANG